MLSAPVEIFLSAEYASRASTLPFAASPAFSSPLSPSPHTCETIRTAARQEMDNPMDLEARFKGLRPAEETDEEERYCICSGFDEGAMIACDGGCSDWFHLSCIGMKEKEQEGIDQYICPSCVKLGRGQTIYKPGVAIPVSSRYHYVMLPPAAHQAVSAVSKQKEEDAKLARLLQEEGRSRRASKHPTEQRKTKTASKKERTTIPGLLPTWRANTSAKTPLKPVRKMRRPQMRSSQGIATTPSSIEGQPTPTPRQEPSPKQQGDPSANKPPATSRQGDDMSDDEMSVDADFEDLQEKEDGKASELEHLEHTLPYDLVRRSLMEELFGKTVDVIMKDIMKRSRGAPLEGNVEEAMQQRFHPTTASWARTRRADGGRH